jgi:hypothetical protein
MALEQWRIDMKTITDITGNTYGRLTVLSFDGYSDHKRPKPQWLCSCSCGNTISVVGAHLKNGNSSSCGCLRKEVSSEMATRHGMKFSRAYQIWQGIKRRVNNPNDDHYHRYGGRGITMCDEWLTSFESFISDMGEPPEGMSIDRIDNDGHYEPDNCRWATSAQQSRNNSRNVWLSANGVTKCLTDWAKELGCSPYTIQKRIRRGWLEADAVTISPHSGNRYFKGASA